MNTQALKETAGRLVTDEKGLLAMDESNPTCNKRFAKVGIPQTEEARRAYREMIITTPRLGESISGVILYDETIRQQKKDGTPFLKLLSEAGIVPGIKVDTGAKDMAAHPGEKITEGLDGLRIRLQEYFQMGARFAKWRAVISIGGGIPNHHLFVVKGDCLKLSSSQAEKIHFARPSAEPLFASVAEVYGKNAIAVVLTGGDGDGSFGVQIIKDKGGTVIAQDRPTSENFSMPETSIRTGDVDYILPLNPELLT